MMRYKNHIIVWISLYCHSEETQNVNSRCIRSLLYTYFILHQNFSRLQYCSKKIQHCSPQIIIFIFVFQCRKCRKVLIYVIYFNFSLHTMQIAIKRKSTQPDVITVLYTKFHHFTANFSVMHQCLYTLYWHFSLQRE